MRLLALVLCLFASAASAAPCGNVGQIQTNGGGGHCAAVNAPLGAIAGTQKTISIKAASYVVQATDSGAWFSNTGATGSITFTLPTAFAGFNSCFVADAAQVIVIAADSGHTIRNATSVTAAGGNFTSNGTQGELLCVIAINTTEWYVSHISGSWAVN
jgi:hypothetical protein